MNARPIRVTLILTVLAAAAPAFGQYRTYSQIGTFLQGVANDHPAITRFYDLGLSVQGRHIWALQITDNPDLEEDEPEFRYISTLHGDEWVGNEMCLYFIDHLTNNYGSDPGITNLVNEIDIWIVPLANPDGYVNTQRYNSHGVDLNRDFPDPFSSPDNTPNGREAETGVIMNWSFGSSFVLSANFHAGALVVNYPFDNDGLGSVNSPSPDDDLFIVISEEYSQYNLPMWNSSSFYHGITNGAAWYTIDGGLQDWGYRYLGSNEVTIELSNTKIPSSSQIPTYWNQNRESMLAYMSTCLIGVRGIVTDATTGLPLFATVRVVGRDHNMYTDPDVGDYHRMLLPGIYDLTFEADGYDSLTVTNVVVSSGAATRLDVELNPPPEVLYPNGGESLDVGVETEVTWDGSASTAFQVQYTDNYGDLSVGADGFESGSLGPDYTTGGNQPWLITTAQAHSGTRSARAGDINDNQNSWMTRTFSGGNLSFWYRVSSEPSYDFFNFYIDDSLEVHASGSTGWINYATTLPPGTYVLKWEYDKDVSVSNGSDTVWIDDLELTVDNTVWSDIVAETGIGASSVPWTPTTIGDSYAVRVRTSYGGGAYGLWDESDAAFSVVDGVALVGDLDGDCDVDLSDLSILLASYASCLGDANYSAIADIDGSGCVDLADLSTLLAHYGEDCG